MKIVKNDITVVIPMYNSERTIISVLDSINEQTARKYIKEIIVVNDGSTDSSADLVRKYNKSSLLPIYIVNKDNGGVSSARNVGMKYARGNWIAFCDSDDLWLKDKIAIQVKVVNGLSLRTNIDFIGGNHTNKRLKILFKSISKIHRANVSELCVKMYPQTSTVLMKKSIFESIGGFDEKQKYAEDGNYFLKIASMFDYYYIPKKLVVYDGGKRGFGVSGLSSNLKGMHKGNIKNIKELEEKGIISKSFFYILFIFYWVKYLRRIGIQKFFSKEIK